MGKYHGCEKGEKAGSEKQEVASKGSHKHIFAEFLYFCSRGKDLHKAVVDCSDANMWRLEPTFFWSLLNTELNAQI